MSKELADRLEYIRDQCVISYDASAEGFAGFNFKQAIDEAIAALRKTEPDGSELAINPVGEAADAFWRYWKANGETHKHGYYESTWGAINAALRVAGVCQHVYAAPSRESRTDECVINPVMSCVCKRGTKSCVIAHADPSRTDRQEPSGLRYTATVLWDGKTTVHHGVYPDRQEPVLSAEQMEAQLDANDAPSPKYAEHIRFEGRDCVVLSPEGYEYLYAMALRSLTARDEWKEAVIEELIVSHVYQNEHENNPRKALNDAIYWNIKVALDPAVCSDAQKLVNEGIEAAAKQAEYEGEHGVAENIRALKGGK